MNPFKSNLRFKSVNAPKKHHYIVYSEAYTQNGKVSFGKLDELITLELIDLCREAKLIVIYGHAKSGKSIITKTLSKELNNRPYIFSDDYLNKGHKDILYQIFDEVLKHEQVIVEGCEMPRFLKYGIKRQIFADIVIHVECNFSTIRYSYNRDGEGHKLNKVINFNKMLDTIFLSWHEEIRNTKYKKPIIVYMNTSIT